jgi:hypothetical protein
MKETLINPFYKKEEEYKRDFYPLKHYINQTASYLQTMTGDDFENCKQWIISKLKTNELGNYKDPTVSYLYRGDNYDREIVEQKLTTLLKDIIKNKEIMAPSLTTYVNEKVEKSMVSASINENIKKRNVAKKAMFAFEAEENRAIFPTYYKIKTIDSNTNEDLGFIKFDVGFDAKFFDYDTAKKNLYIFK